MADEPMADMHRLQDPSHVDPTEAVVALTGIVPLVVSRLLDELTDRHTAAKISGRIADDVRAYANRPDNKGVATFFLERMALNFDNMEQMFLTLNRRARR